MGQESASINFTKPSISLGMMNTNLQAAYGVQQAIHTTEYATELLQQLCELQKGQAEVMGGAGSGGTQGGLLGVDFENALQSAKQSADATESQAYGEFGAAAASAMSGVLCMGLAATGGDKEQEEGIKDLKAFRERLDDSMGLPTIQDESEEAAADERITKWSGTQKQPADFSDITSNDRSTEPLTKQGKELSEDAMEARRVNDQAMEKLHAPHNKAQLKRIQQNLDHAISEKESRLRETRNSKFYNRVQFVNMGNQALNQAADGLGKIFSASPSREAGVDQAMSELYKQVDSTIEQQYGNTQAQVGAMQSMITSTLQNIAFPA